MRENSYSSPKFINICLSVIFRFLLSAIHRLLTEHLCLKRAFSNDTADMYRFNKSLLVCAPLRGVVLFTDSYSDIRWPLKGYFSKWFGVGWVYWRLFSVWGGGGAAASPNAVRRVGVPTEIASRFHAAASHLLQWLKVSSAWLPPWGSCRMRSIWLRE